ncbi:cytidine deaminase 1-like isoform X2 [Gastrolobium bilobum]|uniref:cytidine deaminase 1-like isoform X2 n=1 Tax=Gastrolobium bilobum TaxID=150636 RepID=UPI002AAF85C0|nr:cytidine deaminase 1-like isoform X2 [Gastrolobium bilobum]
MDQPRFVIEASEAESMAQSSGITLTQLLPSLVASAQTLARPPISKFPVAAVGVGSSGRIYVGVNLEFPGLPFHHTVHAEQFLVTNLSMNAETHLESFAVSAAPCGHCRQFLQEIRGAPDIKLLITSEKDPQFTPLSHFLTQRFGPHNLLHKGVPLLLEPHHNALSLLLNNDLPIIPNGISNGYSPNAELKFAALEAANNSHSPYSGSPSGVALLDSQGNIFKGSYMESAAYNPSLGPLQAALVAYVAGGGGDYDKVVAAVLVEKDGAVIRQEHTARLLLHSISPHCHFKVFLCCSSA